MNQFTKILTLFLCLLTPVGSAFAETAASAGSVSYVVTGGGGTNAGGQSIQADEFSGASTYSLTLPVPPSRGGVEPQLTLNYNSQRKNPNSWVGYGWELDLGAIERLPEAGITNYHDGQSFQVRFSGQTETLQLKSANISPATYGLTVSSGVQVDQYEAKIESAFNLYFHLRDFSNPLDIRDEGWIVIDKGGQNYEFGSDSDSREETDRCPIGADASSCTEQHWVARWLLKSVTDPNSNTLAVSYNDSLNPSSITYQDISINFSFDEASSGDFSYFPTYRQGFVDRSHMGVLLDYVTISQGTTRLQKVDFTYATSTYTGVQKLASITQYGSDDTQTLPPTTFDYFDQDTLAWSATSYDMTASVTESEGYTDGFLNYYVQLIDMNADGLPDKVVSYKDSATIHVYYNDGSDFVEIAGKSDWADPIATDSCPDPTASYCYGQLNQYFGDIYLPQHQFVYLMDINGDTLPDRVRAVTGTSGNDDQKDFEVYLNTGSAWSTTYELWRDPYRGDYPGTSDNNNFFMDMNGDGLIDRVVGSSQSDGYAQSGGYYVYYNTGKGFKTTETFWIDPLSYISPDSIAVGRLSGTDLSTGEIHAVLRDFNGDGLPDRLFKGNIINSSDDSIIGIGLFIALNRNGLEWAQPTIDSSERIEINGIDDLAIKYEDTDNHDLITNTNDWVDMNGDGYLDRIEGDEDAGTFAIEFYTGMLYNASYSALSPPVTITDPVDDGDGFDAKGTISGTQFADSGHFDTGGSLHTLIADMNGDGFADRITLTPRNYDDDVKTYKFYPMQINTVNYSDSPTSWANKNVPQPLLGLKEVNDGQGNQLAIEYMPSTWPQRWPSPNHRILPFNLYLAHKLYATDYSMPLTDTAAEASRHPGMRWTTYNYWGGNLFTKYNEHCTEALISAAHDGDSCFGATPYASYDDGSSNPDHIHQVYFGNTTGDPFLQFNGFQSVEKQLYQPAGETWDDFATVTYYHQTFGEVHTVDAADETLFDAGGYSHYAFSGKPYRNEIKTDAYTIVAETSTYEINQADATETFTCDATCYPKLSDTTKTVLESASSTPRISSVSYAYDDYGNLTNQTYYDESGTVLLEKDTTYHVFSSQIHDRPETQTQALGGTLYRKKVFAYDDMGNPITEQYLQDAATETYQTISRNFDANGNLDEITDVDGVSKTMTYDADGLFPTAEQMTLPSGTTLTITRAYNRMNGKPTEELNDDNIGKLTTYDDFGRPSEEYSQDSTGTSTLLKSYVYTYVTETVGDRELTLLKTEIYAPQTNHPETDPGVFPMNISYTDGSGGVLQQCSFAERWGYRLVQFRNSNGGRLTEQTEPVFNVDCSFISTLDSSVPTYQTQKDLQGRVTYSEPPPSDADSPIGWASIAYSTNADGHLVKQVTTEAGDTISETYDANERLIQAVDAQNSMLTYAYNAVGDLTNVTDDSRSLTTITYDDMGRKTQTDDANLGIWKYEYDGNGRLSQQTDNIGNIITFIYDDVGRLTQKDIYDATATKEKYEVYTYDAGDADYDVQAGELFKVEEFTGSGTLLRGTLFSYDALYRRTEKVTRSIPGVGDFDQTMTADFRGQTQSTTYPGGEAVYYQYDSIGNLQNLCSSSDCNADTGEIYYSIDPYLDYNVYGGLLKESFGNGVETEFEYYNLSHRLYQKNTHKGSTSYSQRTYQYDLYSNLTNIGDPLNSKGSGALSSVTYDSLSRLTAYTPSGTASAVSFSYDAQGNMLSNSKSYGTDTYEYTSLKPHAVTKIGDKNFEYDDNGNMTSDPYRVMTYNAQNQLSKVTMTNKTVIDYDYDYTAARTDKTTTRTDPAMANHVSTTYYLGDAMEIRDGKVILHLYANNTMVVTKGLGTLAEVMASAGTKDLHFKPTFRFSMAMPFLLLLFPILFIASFRPLAPPTPAWRVGFRLALPGRDRSLRSKGRERVFSPLLTLWHNYTSAMHEALQALPYNLAPKLLTLFLALLFTIELPLHSAFAGDSGTVANISDATYTYYHHGDHLGSSHVITEGNTAGGKHSGLKYNQGDLIQRYEYAPFGQETYVLNPNLEFDPSYTGQTYDAESGLYYYNARYYNPELGRFIQADTIVPDAKNLQAHNRYSYTANNPLKYVDPSGHGFWSWFKGLIGTIVSIVTGIVLALPSLGLSLMPALIGLISGVAGGVVGGIISGGLKGALLGAFFGALTGTAFAGLGDATTSSFLKHGLSKAAAGRASHAVMGAVGASLSFATGGWKGLATFGVIFAATTAISLLGAAKSDGGGGGESTGRMAGADGQAGSVSSQVASVHEELYLSPNTADGLSLEEANYWYRNGGGKPLEVDASQLKVFQTGQWDNGDAPGVVLGEEYLVHGQVIIKARSDGTYGIYNQKYDFDIQPWSVGTSMRNVGTMIGGYYAGQGTPYSINYQGNANYQGKFPWLN